MKKHKNKSIKKKLRWISMFTILIGVSCILLKTCIAIYDVYVQKSDAILASSKDSSFNANNSNEQNTDENNIIVQNLKTMLQKDNRVQTILNHYEDYPEDLLEMLTHNIDILDFVLDYPQKKGNIYANRVDHTKKGVIPLLFQWDKKWGYATYGDNMLALTGCAPTALSMVIVGLTGDTSITPYVVSQYAQNNGYYVEGTGSSWSLISEGSSYFNVQARELPLSKETIFLALNDGQPIICSMRPGDFTTVGHFIVMVGTKDNKIQVYDPNSNVRSQKLWDYETLSYQINNLWSFTSL